MNKTSAISLTDVTLSYEDACVLDGFNYNFIKDKSYTIIGPSGCGKTTLLYAMAGLTPPTSGQIDFFIPEDKENTAMVLQDYGLFPWKTVWQNIWLGMVIRKQTDADTLQRAKKVVSDLGLEMHLEKYPHQISGGQKQRVAVARAWLLKPHIMLMDEPFSALDTLTRENLQNTIVELNQKRPITWITVTHNIEEAVFLGSDILLMSAHGGAFSHHFINPDFGDLTLREKPAFYDLCTKIRKAMQGVPHEA